MNHINWGKIEDDSVGFSAEIEFISSLFFNRDITIFLGEEIVEPPSIEQLDIYYQTYTKFIESLDLIVDKVKFKTFEQFSRIYQNINGIPLIKNKVEHFQYLEDIDYIRISEETIVRIPIYYSDIDSQHGLEIYVDVSKMKIRIGGIVDR